MIKKRNSQPIVRQWCYQDGGSLTQHFEFILYSWFFLLLYEFGSAYCSEFICICIIPCLCPLPVFPMRVCHVCIYFPKSSLCLFPFCLLLVFLFVSLCISLPHPLCLSHLPCHVPLLVFHPLSPQVCLLCRLPCLLILISASSSCVLVALQNFWILQRFGPPPVRIK